MNSKPQLIISLIHSSSETLAKTRLGAVAGPSSDIRKLPSSIYILQSYLTKPLKCVCRWKVPEGRSSEERRRTLRPSQPSHGSCCYGWDDGWHEDTNGHDGSPDGHHGLDQLLLPRLCIKCVRLPSYLILSVCVLICHCLL